MTKIPESNIKNLQKVSDVYDIFDPAIDYIVRNIIRTKPILGRRTWEQAMIFLAIHQAGKLNKRSTGIGLGVGVERSIFSFAELTKKVIATDLYHSSMGWENVRTKLDPTKHIMKEAPWKIPKGSLEGIHMDMRDIKFDDDTFDYAWSTGSFEHIGNDADFLKHLNEVYRVLKPGGIYAFTTAINYSDQTQAKAGNYFFHPEHMVELVHKSKLLPGDTFDCTVTEHYYNDPLTNRSMDYGFPVGKQLIHPIVGFTRGLITAPNLMVLIKDDEAKKKAKQPIVKGFEETKHRLRREADEFTVNLWSHRQYLNVETAARDSAKVTQWQFFGSVSTKFEIDFVGTLPSQVTVSLRERSILTPITGRVIDKRIHDGVSKIIIEFEPKADKIYRIKIEGEMDLHGVIVHAYHTS